MGDYATTIRSLLELAAWLRRQGVTLVVIEATSSYRKPPTSCRSRKNSRPPLLTTADVDARHVATDGMILPLRMPLTGGLLTCSPFGKYP